MAIGCGRDWHPELKVGLTHLGDSPQQEVSIECDHRGSLPRSPYFTTSVVYAKNARASDLISMFKFLFICTTSLLFTGCASILNDSVHSMKVEAKTSDGQLVVGADCKLTNNYGSVSMKSGDTVQVRRSGEDLDINCIHLQNPDANAKAISRVNGGMLGNIIIGGGIGAIIDHNKGTAYTYPTWVQLVFGKTLVFDRNTEQEGQPTPPVGANQTSTGTTGNSAVAGTGDAPPPQNSDTSKSQPRTKSPSLYVCQYRENYCQ